MKDKKYCKVRDNFHNGSNYDYHFIIKDFAEEFKKQFTCLGENNEKHITLTVPIQKEAARIDKNGEEITKNTKKKCLWQAHYQILPIIFLKEFIKSNVH